MALQTRQGILLVARFGVGCGLVQVWMDVPLVKNTLDEWMFSVGRCWLDDRVQEVVKVDRCFGREVV